MCKDSGRTVQGFRKNITITLNFKKGKELKILQIIAPPPPQFRQTALSFASVEVALGRAIEEPDLLINVTDEHKQARHERLEVNN